MLLSAHFFSGIAIFSILSGFNVLPGNLAWLVLFIVCSVVPDCDMVWSRLHRSRFTHTPFFWACISILIIAITERVMWIIILPIFFHLFLDTLDYGLMVLYPFSRKKHGIAILGKESASKARSQVLYWKAYLSNCKLVCAEFAIILVSLFLFFSILPIPSA